MCCPSNQVFQVMSAEYCTLGRGRGGGGAFSTVVRGLAPQTDSLEMERFGVRVGGLRFRVIGVEPYGP